MRKGGTQAQLAPSRDYQSIRKAAQGILTACEPLLGPLALESSEKIGVRASRAMRKVTIWRHCGLSTHHFRCLQPPRGPPRSGRAASTHGNLVAPLFPAVNASNHGRHEQKRTKHSPVDPKRRIAGWRRVQGMFPSVPSLRFLLLRSREACSSRKRERWPSMASSWRLQRLSAHREQNLIKRGREAASLQTSFKEKEVKNELNPIGGTGRGPIGAGRPTQSRRAGSVSGGLPLSETQRKKPAPPCSLVWHATALGR